MFPGTSTLRNDASTMHRVRYVHVPACSVLVLRDYYLYLRRAAGKTVGHC